jgi:DNA (cytosine-5)-methyltransferase 1
VENVSALLSRGLGEVLGDLASIGYDAEWHCIPASYVGAPHRRDRVWIVAYPAGGRRKRRRPGGIGAVAPGSFDVPAGSDFKPKVVADAARIQPGRAQQRAERERVRTRSESIVMANPNVNAGIERWPGDASEGAGGRDTDRGAIGPDVVPGARRELLEGWRGESAQGSTQWLVEPDVGRVADGVPARVDRLRALGNAIVPQIAEMIGRAIMELEGRA